LNHWKAVLLFNYILCTTFQFLLARKSVLVHHKTRYTSINYLVLIPFWKVIDVECKNNTKRIETAVKMQFFLTV
jgi:hypothetical protein